MALLGSLSWSPTYDATDVAGWRIYASLEESDQRGSAVMLATADARYAEFELEEGTWFVRLCRVFKNGSEEDWSTVTPTEIDVHARQEAPPTPTDVEVAHVEQTSTIRVSDAPPLESATQPYTTEVVEGPDAYRGKVVAETSVETAGPLYPDGQRIASPTVPLEAETTDTTRDLIVRNVSVGGRAGPAVTRTVATPPTLGSDFHEVPLVECHGTTHTGIPNSSTTTPYEFDATDGIRLKAFPAPASLDADWTTLLNANEYAGPYIDNAMIESDELDVGAVTTFRLLSRDQTQRKSDTAYAWSAPPDDLVYIPPDPLPGYRGEALNPNWLMREVDADGKPRRPIRPQDAEVRYIVSATSGFAHARADYKRYDGGTWLRGRYVRVALFLREPLGQFQLICPRWIVSALLPRTTGTITGSPEGARAAVPGSDVTRLDGPPHHYVKATGLGNTGWLASNVPADGTITNAKLADMAQSRIKGRAAGAGTGAPTDLTPAQATAVLDAMVGDSGSGGTKGLVPAPAAGDAAASKFLKADGTWAAPGGGSGDMAKATYDTDNDGVVDAAELAQDSTKVAGTTPSTAGLTLLSDANAAAQRTTLGLGGAAVLAVGTSAGTVAAGDDSRFTLPGTIIMAGFSGTPSGYLTCDGTAVNRTTYAALFAAIGTVWGAGDGSTTFNVPDLRDRFPQGQGGSNGIATTGGAVSPSVSDPGHTHSIATATRAGAATPTSAASVTGSSSTGITVPDGRPPFATVAFFIKT